jgi:hypothetical protein
MLGFLVTKYIAEFVNTLKNLVYGTVPPVIAFHIWEQRDTF